MPTNQDSQAVYTIAEAIRECVHARLLTSLGGEPARSCVIAGAIAWDDCECGQLIVAIAGMWPSSHFPQPGIVPPTRQSRCGAPYIVADYRVSILRCAPSGSDDPNPPTCVDLSAIAKIVTEDAWIARTRTHCCLSEMNTVLGENGGTAIAEFQLGTQLMVGPAGMCQGSELIVQVGILNACPCDE